jgi:hypothetical protein
VIRVVFHDVKPDEVDRLRAWMAELERRADEVRETFRQETVRHEVAYLIAGAGGPILAYAIEVDDEERAREAFRTSVLPIDREHKSLMAHVLAGPADVERLYEVRLEEVGQ